MIVWLPYAGHDAVPSDVTRSVSDKNDHLVGVFSKAYPTIATEHHLQERGVSLVLCEEKIVLIPAADRPVQTREYHSSTWRREND